MGAEEGGNETPRGMSLPPQRRSLHTTLPPPRVAARLPGLPPACDATVPTRSSTARRGNTRTILDMAGARRVLSAGYARPAVRPL